MSNSYWREPIIIGLSICAIILLFLSSQPKTGWAKNNPSENSKQEAAQESITGLRLRNVEASPHDRGADETPCENPTDCKNSQSKLLLFAEDWGDLIAQWIMAFCTFGVLIFTGRGFVVLKRTLRETSVATKSSKIAADAAKRGNLISREMMAAQTRAYLGVFVETADSYKVTLRVENAGQSPATQIELTGVYLDTSENLDAADFKDIRHRQELREGVLLPQKNRVVTLGYRPRFHKNGTWTPANSPTLGYVDIFLQYRDIFRKWHRLTYRACIYRKGDSVTAVETDHGNRASYDEFVTDGNITERLREFFD
ncbi:MAG: hypothetical protein AAF850_03500 [Pseudomonadota bacterium]